MCGIVDKFFDLCVNRRDSRPSYSYFQGKISGSLEMHADWSGIDC